MSPIPNRFSSIHQHANFPPNLEIQDCRLEDESRADTSSSERKKDSFLEDVRSFGIAAKTWDASFRLLDYLVGRPSSASVDKSDSKVEHCHCYSYRYEPLSPLLSDSSTSTTLQRTMILDLGSGACHLPIGLARALSKSKEYSNQHNEIMATDLKDVLPLLQRNTGRENLAQNVKISARALTWGDPEEIIQLINSFGLDTCHHEDVVEEETQFIITCSDLIFFRWLFGPLIRTLLFLTSPATCYPATVQKLRPFIRNFPTATIFIGYKQRSEFLEFPFFLLLGRYFKLEPIICRKSTSKPRDQAPPDSTDDEKEEDIIHLLKATRHPSTLDLDLSLVFDHDDPTSSDTCSLSKYGLAEGADQWELITFSNLVSQT